MKKIKIIIGIVAMFGVLLLSGCGNAQPSAKAQPDNNEEVTTEEEATTPPAEEEETSTETKTVQLYTNYDGTASPEEKYDYTGELTAEVLGLGLTELTGLYYTFTSETMGNDIYVDWSMDPGLMSDGDPEKMSNFFGDEWPEYGSQQWFMMDSLWYTLTNNLGVENVYYTMDGGQELRIDQILYNTNTFPSDVPYMGSEFYFAHDDVKGEENLYSSLDAWNAVSGSFGRQDNNQYSNATLQLKQISEGCFLFEFDLLDGSETKETEELLIPFILTVDENGVGHYESLPDEVSASIEFYLSEDGQQVTVTHTGTIDISPDGVYDFVDDWIDVSVLAGIEVLKCLPPASTSLNSYNQPCIFNYYDELIDDMYYEVEAVYVDTNTVFAKFLIASDLSDIYRVDDGMESELIFDAEHPLF